MGRWSRAAAAVLATGVAAIACAPAQGRGYIASVTTDGLQAFADPFVRNGFYTDGAQTRLDRPSDLVVSPDGAIVWAITGDALTPVDTASFAHGTPIAVTAGAGSRIALTPDGRTALVASPAGDAVTPVDTTSRTAGATIAVSDPADVAVAPDGKMAYAVTKGATLIPIDLATRTARTPVTLAHPATAISMTPDGALAVVAEADGPDAPSEVQVVRLADLTAEAPVAISGRGATALAVNAGGTTAFVGSSGGTVVPFDIASRTGGAAIGARQDADGTDAAVSSLATQADGGHVLGTIPCASADCGWAFAYQLDAPANPSPGENPEGATLLGSLPGPRAPSSVAVAPEPSVTFEAPNDPQAGLTRGFYVIAPNSGGDWPTFRYDFGDGSADAVGPANDIAHTFPAYGTYRVTVTTTNTGGCAAKLVFTGHSALCSGRAMASMTRDVTVIPAPDVPAGGGVVPVAKGSVTLRSTTLRLSGARVRVPVSCAGTVACRGRLTLALRVRTARHRLVTVGCGSGALRLGAGHAGRVAIVVRRTCRARARRTSRGLALRLTSRMTSGQPALHRSVRLMR